MTVDLSHTSRDTMQACWNWIHRLNPQRVVQVFYKDNKSYLKGACQPISAFDDITTDVVAKYIQMLNDPDVSRADDRRSAVEFQVSQSVSLITDLQAVVLPESFLDDKILERTILEDWNALPITYSVFQATCPSEYAPVIRDRVMSFYEQFWIV